MSTHVSNAEEDIPLESRQPLKVPDPGTEIRNNNLPSGAIVRDMTAEGEHIPGMVKESTVWDVYNDEARNVDSELVKDWTASLNFLLVFAAIFAAVLTAFIIESKKMLEQDPTEILVDITMQYFNSIGSQSRNNFTRPDFQPTSAAISINCLLFASLGASLVAALASVVALQWVADYDAAITRGGSSPLDRAKRRQFRYAGVTGWKMGELIAALPLLLYSSVILFWAGAIQWMWTLHPIVGYVVAGGTAIAVLFYISTTLLGTLFVSSPFRTPLSRGVYWLAVCVLSLVGRLLLSPPTAGAFRFLNKLCKRIYSRMPALIPRESRRRFLRNVNRARTPLSESIPKWINDHLITSSTFRTREDETAKQDPLLEQEALAWLAQQLPISHDSHERLFLCASGILGLSTDNPPSPRFHDAPWLAILNVPSEHFLRRMLDSAPTEEDYQGVGILLQCIDSPFIRSKVVPDANYDRDPTTPGYWSQCCLAKDGTQNFGAKRRAPMAFLLSRDVPVPSLGSKHELEATWKLIKWRNLISTTHRLIRSDDIWPEVFSDIGRYSPEFLESCLCHFQTWTDTFWNPSNQSSKYAIMFDSVVEQALYRDLTIKEALALVHAFAGYLAGSLGRRSWVLETIDETNILLRPMSYTLTLGRLSESTRATHLALTLLGVRVARSLVRTELLKWVRWFTLMIWIALPKEREYLNALRRNQGGPPNVWDEIEKSSTNVAVHGPHVEEIARIMWRVDNNIMQSLSGHAFGDLRYLRYLELLIQWVPHCYTHHTGSQHILLHLYQGANSEPRETNARFLTRPICLEGFNWTELYFNPILAMLALSDSQDLACLHFSNVDLECAGRIFEIIKAVKAQPAAFSCLLVDIVNRNDRDLRLQDVAIMLELVKQLIPFSDDESTTSFLRPLALGLHSLGHRIMPPNDTSTSSANSISTVSSDRSFWNVPSVDTSMAAEAQKIHRLLQAKYAARLISSTAQLRLLSCARSAAVAEPATGWLRTYESP